MKRLSKVLFLLMLTFAVLSCKKDPEPEPVKPIISGFTPGNGPVTTAITIFGANFGTTAPTVKFGTVAATVTSFSQTQIVTSVPTGATTGKITVTTADNQTVTSTTDFVVGGFPQVVVGNGPAGTITELSGTINWTKANRYLLKGLVVVKDGATLNIEAGTVILGDKATRGGLIIARGGKINATGTAAEPIVFTSSQPKGERNYGDWIGILIAGKAKNNAGTDRNFEGLADNALFKYGIGTGADTPADNSGTLKYVRIEFSGIAISDGNETNGLTLGSVGTGTTIEYVQVSFCGDDSFEWFGGTVNGKWLIAFRGWDDDFDTDNGFTGNIQYGLAFRDPFIADQSQSNSFESDNDSGSSGNMPLTAPVFSNITFIGGDRGVRGTGSANSVSNANYGRALHLRRNTSTSVFNSVFIGGFLAGLSLDASGTQGKFETGAADEIQFRSNVFSGTSSASGTVRGGNFAFETSSVFSVAGTTQQASFDANNSIIVLADLKLPATFTTWGTNGANALTLGANLLPANDSPLLTGAIFTGKAATGFTTTGTFRGAFGTTNWTTGWANFDPQNTDY
jgi:hypothetical protein